MSVELIQVAESNEYLWNSAICTEKGRLFSSLPGWLGPTPGVVEVFNDGSFKPFPGNEWNQWKNGGDPTKSFVDVNSIIPDGKGSLWVLDAAAPLFSTAIEGAVKIVELDIATGATKRVIIFDKKDAHSGTRLAHMRFHGDHAFIAESKEGSFYVIDLRDNSYRRILVGHPLMRCLPDDVPTIEGRKVHLLNGKPMYIHNDLLEFGKSPDTLYFMCLFGSKIFKIDVDVLKNSALSDEFIAAHVEVAAEVPPVVAGITRDVSGNLYITDAEANGIARLHEDGTIEPIVSDPEIVWPISPSIGPDGYMYFTSSQLNRVPMFSGGSELVVRPWKMFKVKVLD
jgi:sugar lactone lactonase YvrE